MATFSGPFENAEFTGPGVYQTVNGIRCEIDAIAPGTVTIEAVIAPLINSSFQLTVNNPNRNDITFNSTDGFSPISGPAVVVFSFTTNLKRFSIGYTFSGSVWELSHFSNLDPDTVRLSEDVAIAGTTEVELFELQRYDPAAGGMTIEAPSSPMFRDKFGIKNLTFDTTSILIDGNGFNLQNPQAGGLPVASFATTVPRAQAIWEFDGTEWVLIQIGIAFASTIGNFAGIGRPETVTVDVAYTALYTDITTPYTFETDGLGLAADFTVGTITSSIATRMKDIMFQATCGANNGTRTDVTIALNGTPIGAPFTFTGSGLTSPHTVIASALEVDIVATDVITAQIRNDHPSGIVRWWALDLVAVQL